MKSGLGLSAPKSHDLLLQFAIAKQIAAKKELRLLLVGTKRVFKRMSCNSSVANLLEFPV